MNQETLDPQTQLLTSALRREPGVWTPDCLPPERLADLALGAVPESEAVALMEHVALCARCRAEYAETVELAQLSAEVRELEAPAAPAPVPPPREPFWRRWFRPALALSFGAAGAAAILYAAVVAPAWERQQRLASELGSTRTQAARLERDLAAARQASQGQENRLKEQLKQQEVRMARLETDAAVLREMPVPAPSWLREPSGGRVRGGSDGGSTSEIGLIGPADTAVLNGTPLLEWRPVAGASSYQVSIEPEDGTEEIAPPPPVTTPQWRVTPALPPGRVYQWAVTAQKGSRTLRSRTARFYVLSPDERRELDAAVKRSAGKPLALGAVNARLGLQAEARQQLQAAVKADPDSVAKKWLAELPAAAPASR